MSFMFDNEYRILSMMIAPGLFMTATGSLIISSNNRQSRVIDRIRVLINLIDHISLPTTTLDHIVLRKRYYHEELENLRRRGGRVRRATALLYLSFACFVGASLLIGLDMFLSTRYTNIPTGLAMAGVTSLLVANIYLFRESSGAVRTIDLEIEFIRCLQLEREGVPDSKFQTPS